VVQLRRSASGSWRSPSIFLSVTLEDLRMADRRADKSTYNR
jgi:hypothetical protein